jgi:hypothetical protein
MDGIETVWWAGRSSLNFAALFLRERLALDREDRGYTPYAYFLMSERRSDSIGLPRGDIGLPHGYR